MWEFQDKFKVLYKNINLEGDECNPNEAYTELVALIIFAYWRYSISNKTYSIEEYLTKHLTIELGWSFLQIAKILKHFKCYNDYESLFSNTCKFKQKTNVLSYFILKTYYLFNLEKISININFNSLKQTKEKTDSILKNTNLLDKSFNIIINSIMNDYDLNDDCLRMTCLD
tara:strand:- start:139 stop:651 length:513 start_codon:yes stop_codon:yes gene_type:complete